MTECPDDEPQATPRTDVVAFNPFGVHGATCGYNDVVPIAFARQLERELIKKTAEIESLQDKLATKQLELKCVHCGAHENGTCVIAALRENNQRLRVENAQLKAEAESLRAKMDLFEEHQSQLAETNFQLNQEVAELRGMSKK